MGTLNKLKQLSTAIIWIITSLSLAVTVTIFVSSIIYRLCIQWLNLSEIAGLSSEDLMRNYQAVLSYLIHPFVTKMSLPHFSSSAGGLQHFYEVKQLMWANFVWSGLGLLLSIWLWRCMRQQRYKGWLNVSLRLASWLPLFLLCLVIVAFERLFVLFHQVFFRNDLWLFNPLTDPIITVLPQEFFMLLFLCTLFIYEILVTLLKLSIKR